MLDEVSIVMDEAGRKDKTYHRIYQVLTADGVEIWGMLSTEWAPWNEERPEVIARVVSPDGTEFSLDPGTVDVVAADEDPPMILNDRQALQAHLPGLTPGAIVEWLVRIRETSPALPGGNVEYIAPSDSAGTDVYRLVLDIPAGTPLHHVAHLLPRLSVRTEEEGKRVRWIFEHSDLTPPAKPKHWMTPRTASQPYVAFSTASSWAGVAEQYYRLITPRLKDREAAALLPAGKKRPKDLREAVNLCLARLHGTVRYAGLEFGQTALVPHPPREILARKYGDCKDHAALLIAMLDAWDIEASMALLRMDAGFDVERDLPGIGGFNHAIVYVHGNPGFWVDPTDKQGAAGFLSPEAQGRLALIIAPGTKSLLPTSVMRSAENAEVETQDIWIPERGNSRVVEETRALGNLAADYRRNYADADRPSIEKNMQDYVASRYLSTTLDRFDHSDVSDLAGPFSLRVEASGAKRAMADLDGAFAAVPINSLVEPVAWLGEQEGVPEGPEEFFLRGGLLQGNPSDHPLPSRLCPRRASRKPHPGHGHRPIQPQSPAQGRRCHRRRPPVRIHAPDVQRQRPEAPARRAGGPGCDQSPDVLVPSEGLRPSGIRPGR